MKPSIPPILPMRSSEILHSNTNATTRISLSVIVVISSIRLLLSPVIEPNQLPVVLIDWDDSGKLLFTWKVNGLYLLLVLYPEIPWHLLLGSWSFFLDENWYSLLVHTTTPFPLSHATRVCTLLGIDTIPVSLLPKAVNDSICWKMVLSTRMISPLSQTVQSDQYWSSLSLYCNIPWVVDTSYSS